MAKYRLGAIANLARQLNFTPLETRSQQLAAAEVLLHDLETEKAYPLDFVVYRITGYQPKTDGNSDLLTGLALQHDLGLLIENVSESLDLRASDLGEPVLSIDDVTERFSVTSKTIQRWRRKGLPARRFVFADGKRRVGFFLSSVERFIVAHRNQLGSTTVCTALLDDEQSLIVRHARRLTRDCGATAEEISLRIGRKFHRTPMTILHTLRKHDALHPQAAVLPLAAMPLTDDQVNRITAGHRRGMQVKALADRIERRRSAVYRAIVHDRVARLNKRTVRFIDDELYHDLQAGAMIEDIVSQQELVPASVSADAAAGTRVPNGLPPYLQELYRTPLLSAARERALFLKFNFHKYQFVSARRRLEPEFARARDLSVLENHLREITAAKNQILQANLRLVVSVARRHVRPGVCLMELISEGNIILMRAVEGFDIHKGNRFSTYATLALMKGFAQAVPALLASRRGTTDVAILSNIADPRHDCAIDQRLNRDQVQHMLLRLDDRERLVLCAHYGLGSDQSFTYEQVGAKLGLSRQRVRQIEQTALAKLRSRQGRPSGTTVD